MSQSTRIRWLIASLVAGALSCFAVGAVAAQNLRDPTSGQINLFGLAAVILAPGGLLASLAHTYAVIRRGRGAAVVSPGLMRDLTDALGRVNTALQVLAEIPANLAQLHEIHERTLSLIETHEKAAGARAQRIDDSINSVRVDVARLSARAASQDAADQVEIRRRRGGEG